MNHICNQNEQGYYNSVVEKLSDYLLSIRAEAELLYHKHLRYRDKYINLDVVIEDRNHHIIEIYIVTTLDIYKHAPGSLTSAINLYQSACKAARVNCAYIHNGELYLVDAKDIEQVSRDTSSLIHTVSSLSKYISIISGLEIIESYKLFYRGHSNSSYVCIPSIYRSKAPKSPLVIFEDILFHEAIRKRPEDFPSGLSTFDTLVKMQHYSMPTRLLDITENPLIALYFACISEPNNDGEVLLFAECKDTISYYDSNDVCVLSNLAKQDRSFSSSVKKNLLDDVKKELGYFDGRSITKNSLAKVICVLPKMSNERIKNQTGAFYLFGMNGTIINCPIAPNPMVRITIPSSLKTQLLEELSHVGINESYVFPELDKSMEMLKRKYSELC